MLETKDGWVPAGSHKLWSTLRGRSNQTRAFPKGHRIIIHIHYYTYIIIIIIIIIIIYLYNTNSRLAWIS